MQTPRVSQAIARLLTKVDLPIREEKLTLIKICKRYENAPMEQRAQIRKEHENAARDANKDVGCVFAVPFATRLIYYLSDFDRILRTEQSTDAHNIKTNGPLK